jgi:hypothetical protein
MTRFKTWLFAFFAAVCAVPAFATSVLDTATTTAITGGFTDLQDTILDLLTIVWPFLIGVAVIMMTPRIVTKLIHMVGGR